MKAISAIVTVILILLISVSLASFAYIFLTGVLSTTTQAGTETVEHISSSLLAEMKIESLMSNSVSVKNTGKVNLTSFNVFVNNILDTVDPSTLMPGDILNIGLSNVLNPGDIVKVTTAQGATAIKALPS